MPTSTSHPGRFARWGPASSSSFRRASNARCDLVRASQPGTGSPFPTPLEPSIRTIGASSGCCSRTRERIQCSCAAATGWPNWSSPGSRLRSSLKRPPSPRAHAARVVSGAPERVEADRSRLPPRTVSHRVALVRVASYHPSRWSPEGANSSGFRSPSPPLKGHGLTRWPRSRSGSIPVHSSL